MKTYYTLLSLIHNEEIFNYIVSKDRSLYDIDNNYNTHNLSYNLIICLINDIPNKLIKLLIDNTTFEDEKDLNDINRNKLYFYIYRSRALKAKYFIIILARYLCSDNKMLWMQDCYSTINGYVILQQYNIQNAMLGIRYSS